MECTICVLHTCEGLNQFHLNMKAMIVTFMFDVRRKVRRATEKVLEESNDSYFHVWRCSRRYFTWFDFIFQPLYPPSLWMTFCDHQCRNLRRQRADPSSSYSDFVTHIASKSGLDAKSDPPRQTPKIGLQKSNKVRTTIWKAWCMVCNAKITHTLLELS